jgi:hypothetical protein
VFKYVGPIVAIACILSVAALVIVLTVRSDRKRAGRIGIDWVGKPGRLTACVSVSVVSTKEAAIQAALEALRKICACDVMQCANGVVGWTDVHPITGWFFGWAPQELAIEVRVATGGNVELLCCSRPRFAIAVSDLGRHQEVAFQLAAMVSSAANPSR